jgi:hypothetical protein
MLSLLFFTSTFHQVFQLLLLQSQRFFCFVRFKGS